MKKEKMKVKSKAEKTADELNRENKSGDEKQQDSTSSKNVETKSSALNKEEQISSKEKNTPQMEEILRIKDQFIRLQADFQNFRNRSLREKNDAIRFAKESLVIKFIDIFDNFERALATDTERNSFYDGIQLIFQSMKQILENEGLEEMKTTGELFDPNKHHAIVSEKSEDVKVDHIIETFQKGYLLNGRVIRPAMVKVAK